LSRETSRLGLTRLYLDLTFPCAPALCSYRTGSQISVVKTSALAATIPLSAPKTMSSNWTRPEIVGEAVDEAWKQGETAAHREIRLQGVELDALEPAGCRPRQLQALFPRADLGIRARYPIAHHLGCRSQNIGRRRWSVAERLPATGSRTSCPDRDYDQSDRGAAEKREAPVGGNSAAINQFCGHQ